MSRSWYESFGPAVCVATGSATILRDNYKVKNRLRSIMVKAIGRINTHGDVAMTRTKDELDLIVPQRLFMYQQNDDRHVYTKMSRFIPKSTHHAFEQKHWSERTREPTFS